MKTIPHIDNFEHIYNADGGLGTTTMNGVPFLVLKSQLAKCQQEVALLKLQLANCQMINKGRSYLSA